MLADQRLELADQVRVSAEREVGLDPLLERGEAQVLEPRGLRLRERLVCELRQRRPTPELECLAQELRGMLQVRLPRVRNERLEAQEIERVRLDRESDSRAVGSARPPRAAASASARRTPAPSSPPSPAADRPRARRSADSRATTRFAFNSKSARSARCFTPPSGSGPSPSRPPAGQAPGSPSSPPARARYGALQTSF